jgi:transposase
MAKRQRRSYSDEYKRRAVDLVVSSGRSAKSVAKELGLDGSVLSRWVTERNAVQADGSAPAPTTQAALPGRPPRRPPRAGGGAAAGPG